MRFALLPVENATIISKNGNITVDEISNNNIIATDCNENARGGFIYNFLHSGLKTTNTTVSLGDINLKQVLNNHLESTLSDLANPKALNGRHASGGIIANSIQSCQGNAIIKSINGEYIGNSLVSKSEIMDASGGVIVNTATIKAINNSIFKNNYASSVNGTNAHGGAIYTRQDLVTQKCGEV